MHMSKLFLLVHVFVWFTPLDIQNYLQVRIIWIVQVAFWTGLFEQRHES